nr:MAG TPA: hypothetical protein [Caudoviricetes sp.]
MQASEYSRSFNLIVDFGKGTVIECKRQQTFMQPYTGEVH